jgi:hypothetical protein
MLRDFISCRWRYRRWLSPSLDGELDAARRAQLERHLAACKSCRREYDDLRFASRLASQVALPEQTPGILPAALRQQASLAFLPNRRLRIPLVPLASALLVILAAAVFWYYTHPSNAPWEVARVAGTPKIGAEAIGANGRLAKGEWLETDGASRARISVGRIGEVNVEPNTRLRLVETRLTEHRLELARGRLHASIWAPPRLFFIDTPSAVAADLGCVYSLVVDEAGSSLLHVTSGWVAFETAGRQSKVPAGALCETRPGTGPGTPYFEDASVALQIALTQFDFESGESAALTTVLKHARARDTLTLWHLLARVSEADRGRIYDRLAAFAAPPESVTREGVLQLDPKMLTAWREKLEPVWLPESLPTLRKVWRWLWR